jgi:RND family efflux transporter MFP subunit
MLDKCWRGIGLFSFILLAGCQAKHAAPSAEKGAPEVFVSVPVTKEINDYEEFSGRLDSDKTIQLRARVTGYLLAAPPGEEKVKGTGRFFKEGGLVKTGDLLFKIDSQLYEAELALAEGNVVEAQGQYEQCRADWLRVQKLRVGDQISPEELNKFKGAYAIADGKLKAAKANLKRAQVNMSYTKVTAPLSGRISRALVDPGNLVKADDTVLVAIGSVDPIKAYFDVDERTVLRVIDLIKQNVITKELTGVKVEMGLANEDDRPHRGTIDFFDTYVDAGTGTLRVRGAFENHEELLVPGMFVRVRLPIGEEQKAILIAEKALVTDQGQKFVYVVKEENTAEHEGKVEYRQVKIGRLHEGLRVIKEGLTPGEKVVVGGLQRVRPDIKVKFKDAEMPVNTAPAPALDPTKTKAAGANPSTISRVQPGGTLPIQPNPERGNGKRMKGR